MSENYTHLAWIDLETTGSDEATENIIEVGLAITEATPQLGIVDQRSWVVTPTEPGKLLHMDPVVIDMHTKSGLLADVLRQLGLPPYITKVDDVVYDTLQPYLTNGRIPLAGSGVAHFDKRFIDRFMPRTASVLTYAPYDVGSVRRYLRLAGMELESPSEGLTHRALADVQDHMAEARKYLDWFQTFVNL